MTNKGRIAVAMSGGVDSSVAAALLCESGEDVFGLMLHLQDSVEDRTNQCCAPTGVASARSVAAELRIPFYVLDARRVFEDHVIAPFVSGYAQGITPNPCVVCNRMIRFGFLLEQAMALGATRLASGHYARIEGEGASRQLRVARDQAKDQSYVLHMLTQHQLASAAFPLGGWTKEQVRAHARRMRLPIAEKPESQDLCFAQGDYRTFLAARGVAAEPGPIVDREGVVLGSHTGLSAYTLGQRKGLRIAAREPLYVIDKDLAHNALIVGGRDEVGRRQFSVTHVHWIAGAPPADSFDASVQVRYHAPRAEGRVHCTSTAEARVQLAARNPDVAPGQSAVFYLDDVCLGGGIISL